jgi:hypothetical protein
MHALYTLWTRPFSFGVKDSSSKLAFGFLRVLQVPLSLIHAPLKIFLPSQTNILEGRTNLSEFENPLKSASKIRISSFVPPSKIFVWEG